MIQFLKRHTLISIYFFVFAGLLYGVAKTSGTTYFPELVIYFLSLIFFYFLFSLKRISGFFSNLLSLRSLKINLNIYFLVIPVWAFVIFHFIYLGGSPSIQATNLTYIEEVAKLRQSITTGPPSIILYLSAIILKSALPFLILYLLFTKRQTLYWIVLIVGVFYASSLLQKSYIVGLLIPALIYCVVSKKYVYVLKYFALMVGVVFILTFVANPPAGSSTVKVLPNLTPQKSVIADSLKKETLVDTSQSKVVTEINQIPEERVVLADEDAVETSVENIPVVENVEPTAKVEEKKTRYVEEEVIKAQASRSKLQAIARGLIDRILVVPGRVVSDWFEVIPSQKPFLYGDGYRVLAKIRGREYHNYSKELYPIISAEFAAQGLDGSVNVASFMYEYSNFGTAGMVLSGFMLALLFILIETFFADNFRIKLSLNLFPVLLLSSGAITTLMFSGGWGFSILFYFLFLKNKSE